MTQLTQADMGQVGGDLRHPSGGAEVEEPRGRHRIDDPIDEGALEAERDAVLRLLGEFEAASCFVPGTRT